MRLAACYVPHPLSVLTQQSKSSPLLLLQKLAGWLAGSLRVVVKRRTGLEAHSGVLMLDYMRSDGLRSSKAPLTSQPRFCTSRRRLHVPFRGWTLLCCCEVWAGWGEGDGSAAFVCVDGNTSWVIYPRSVSDLLGFALLLTEGRGSWLCHEVSIQTRNITARSASPYPSLLFLLVTRLLFALLAGWAVPTAKHLNRSGPDLVISFRFSCLFVKCSIFNRFARRPSFKTQRKGLSERDERGGCRVQMPCRRSDHGFETRDRIEELG